MKCSVVLEEQATGYEHYGVEPDIYIGKGIRRRFSHWGPLRYGTIRISLQPGIMVLLGGNPWLAVLDATLKTIINDKLCENSASMGEYFMDVLNRLKEEFPSLLRCGKGLMIVEFSKPIAGDIKLKLFDLGYLVSNLGSNIRMLPYDNYHDDIDGFINALKKVLQPY